MPAPRHPETDESVLSPYNQSTNPDLSYYQQDSTRFAGLRNRPAAIFLARPLLKQEERTQRQELGRARSQNSHLLSANRISRINLESGKITLEDPPQSSSANSFNRSKSSQQSRLLLPLQPPHLAPSRTQDSHLGSSTVPPLNVQGLYNGSREQLRH